MHNGTRVTRRHFLAAGGGGVFAFAELAAGQGHITAQLTYFHCVVHVIRDGKTAERYDHSVT